MSLPKLPKLLKRPGVRRRTPTLLQMEAVECGAAALGIILGYYGRIVPLAKLRQDCGVSRDGSKASNILNAARNYGLNAKGFKAELNQLMEMECPFIVFWNFNHFLVVEGYNKQRVFLNDPASGPRHVSLEEFSNAFTGVVLILQPGPDFKKGGSKPSIIKALWQRLRFSLWALTYCVLAGLLLVIPGLAMPTFAQVFVDNVLIERRQEWLSPLILGILITACVTGFLTLLQLQSLRRMKIKLSVGMSSQFLWHILRLPVSFYDQRFAGEISSRVNLNDSLASILSGRLATTAIAVVTVIFYAVVMLQYDKVLTSIGIAFVIINLLALQWVSRRRIDANMRLQQDQGKVAGVSISGLQSMETLKASGLESDFFSRWAGYYAKSVNSQQEMDVTNQTLGVLPSFLTTMSSMLLITIGGLRVMDGHLSIGMLVAFQGLMQQFLLPVNNLVNLGSDLQRVEGDITRLDDVLRNPTDTQVDQEIQKVGDNIQFAAADRPVVRLQGYVDLRNVTFGYNRIGQPLIENFNFSLKPGQRVALVGGSGSGKSTVAKLVAGLYEPWQGDILFDGQTRSQIPRQVLVNSLALVEQDIFLFAGSVRDNLTLWDTTVPDSYLLRACKDAAIHDVVSSLPGGYGAQLLEGAANLSGGQRQRLEIARALVNNPAILVMDEATSALDSETEKIIDRKLRQRGCTCIIVAHRLSTIRDCDEIIVMEKGKVVQRGTHDELKEVEGAYLRLIRSEGEAL
ncbi:NHLP family bacteriocin export ABC transporter peptidase/permease/ATPase subunit [Nostoc sp. 106C]|uniref:NHLP family bacteriocin export ABC transporter peptidase/permease/ATPase subunit n=1 Tax=Nostoc sp. 106C TaxID=1932667 RepID=UPI000A39007C|nr:NHLP family bacteriocin export ABC transporter peptidase/permease/ATPase subunit [Nostoc sp. 106C]OUL19029.1 NHLP family bacteriocin export ABC transporter peptidase/permease/ATPase subunit [Nostoc sp. RF31YmG]OUL21533.1 NHLP family bacteriocin export ABC transporter peptidase/permease/ATPase subunit [Nostoc sp. 106C]